jgi:hypothetical protein
MSLHAILVALALSLGFVRAPSVLTAIESAAPDEDTARLMVVWGFYESGLNNSIPGDGGRARCFLQVRDRGDLDAGACARVWLGMLAYAERECGTRRAALGSLATGKCGGAPKLVARRLERAGVMLP